MNNRGIEYISNIEKLFIDKCKELKKIDNNFNKPQYNWNSSLIQERILRLGLECKYFNLDIYNTIELEKIAIATLKEDFIKTDNYILLNRPIDG